MKKQYSSPTYSSSQKALPQINLQERIVRLTDSVNELRTNAEVEAQNQDSLEKSNSKNYIILNTQIKALKKAFNTLADVMMEELETIKSEVFKDFQDTNATVYRRLDDLSTQLIRVNNDKQEQKAEVNTLEQQLKERIKVLERKDEENMHYIHSIAEATKEDQRALFEKLNGVLKHNTSKLDALIEDHDRVSQIVDDLRKKANESSAAIGDLRKHVGDVEQSIKRQDQELSSKLAETKTAANTIRETLKAEVTNITKGQTDFARRLEEMSTKMNDKLQTSESAAQKRYAELEDLVNQVQQEFQDNVQELAKIHKESSTQIIVDFEKAMTSINSDNKVLYKKFAVLENSLSKSREELGVMISDHEHLVSKKNEQFNKAIFDICRQMNITNPMLNY